MLLSVQIPLTPRLGVSIEEFANYRLSNHNIFAGMVSQIFPTIVVANNLRILLSCGFLAQLKFEGSWRANIE